jgi:zinc transport system permease protein
MIEALSYGFMQNALIAGLLVSIICGIIGSLVVVNRMVFIAGGIAHGAYGGIGAAFFLGIAPLFGATLFALLLGMIIAFLTLKDRGRIDSVIGTLWAFGMALGIILTDLTPGYNVDLMSYLFGSILSVPTQDLWIMGGITGLIITIIGGGFRSFQAMSFDPEFASLRGVHVKMLHYILIGLIALCVVATIRVVGLVLVIALLSIPPYIAERISARLSHMMFLSTIIGMFFVLCGLGIAYMYDVTSGAAIIMVASLGFFASLLLTKARD